MPLIEATIAEGRTPEQIRSLMHEVHEAVRRSLGSPPESIRVVVREIPRTHWSSGGLTLEEIAAREAR
ncbi:tautomerase family protein [Streptosporangium soli]|nr:tautomerase family protein [Streptosporangium sp. KLBMP 9127]